MVAKLRFYIRRLFCKRNKISRIKDNIACINCLKYGKCYPPTNFYEGELDYL